MRWQNRAVQDLTAIATLCEIFMYYEEWTRNQKVAAQELRNNCCSTGAKEVMSSHLSGFIIWIDFYKFVKVKGKDVPVLFF
jgi:hypothetical protein